ncbi:fungal specific transcription factor domain-containing protein [Trichoderma breve]|uniref:Fungal specific transcription factor domain-containing protein n=1 Tax=Trichoderma breve TaxID=2034170 RepID=A0A9W9ED81_9HYPO|nr:fungal specific transcription factor domain-containing protein [Trichoderma breve]KAJ4864457.1 fungal specific transcription factor domain-containing protein [Trichoderma breve]
MDRAPKRLAASVDEEDSAPAPPLRESVLQSSSRGTRSCEGCYQRKIRCDRGVPCANCSRHGMTCVYPTRDPDAAQKPCTLRDVSNRLERLESLLSLLVERTGVLTGLEADSGSNRGRGRAEPEITIQPRPISDNVNTASHHRLPTQLGAAAPPDRDSDLLDVYPDAQLALRLWNVYVRSVDPVLKILHIPTIQSAVVATILDARSAQPSMVALTFAIYYAAVTALCHHDCDEPVDLSWEKPVLLKHYQTALDRLLVTPDFMKRPDMTGLQALAIYVTCSRANELGRPVWVLNGLVIRLAQSIGLHRDGASLKLSLFESEMRLRLWWHLCVLESRASEDQGFQPTIDITNTGLRLPLNVNDDQIYPDMTHFPAESRGWTEMSFFLIQIDACRVIHPILDKQQQDSGDALLSTRKKGRRKISDPVQYMAEKYGITPGSNSVTPLRKEISIPKQKEAQDDDATPDAPKLSFKLACDCLESSHVLLKEGLASRFTWLFSMYTQWYALAYVLRCLCINPNPRGFEADRAWTLLRHRAWSLRQHAQTSAATRDVWVQSHSGRYWTRQRPSNAEILPPTIDPGISILPEWVSEFPASSNQNVFGSLDLLMPEIPFLPDWNAVINGR